MKHNYEISMDYNTSKIIDKKLCLIFDVHITSFGEEVKRSDLKKEIEKLIPKQDRRYINIYKYDTKKVFFIFDANKWFDDSSKRIVPTEDRYMKRLELKLLPTIVTNNVSFITSTSVVEQSFRNYLNKNSDFRKKIQNCIVKNEKLVHYKFQYDSHASVIFITLKPQFRTNILLKLKTKKADFKKTNFDETVATLLKI